MRFQIYYMKTYIKNKNEFDNFVKIYENNNKINVLCYLDEPQNYPCILVWRTYVDIVNNKNVIDGQYVYLDDFKL